MRNNEQLPRGRQIFGVTTPLPPVRTKDDPTKEEAAKANAGEYAGETRTVKGIGNNRLLKIALGGGVVVGGGTLAYETVPAFHQAVDSAFLDHIRGKSSEASISPDVFDNNATKGVITEMNTIVAGSLDEIKDIPQSSDGGHSINILLPIKSLPPSGEIEYRRDLAGKSAFNPVYTLEVRQYALEHGIKNTLYLKNIPAGYTILAPVDGEFLYNRIRSDTPEGTIDGPAFFFKDENGILYQIDIFDASGNTLAPVLDVPFRTMKDARDNYRKFLHPIKKGEPIATLLQQGDIGIFAQAWPSGQSGIEQSPSGEIKHVYPTNLNLITLPDPSTGKDKAALVASR